MIARDHESAEVEELRLGHEFAPCRGQNDWRNKKSAQRSFANMHDSEPVVVNCVFILLPMMPCRPILALINPTQTNESTFDHAGFERASATLPWPDFHMAMAAAMVKSVWMNVPRDIQRRVLHPSLSPRRPMKAPAMKQRTEQKAWRSARWKE